MKQLHLLLIAAMALCAVAYAGEGLARYVGREVPPFPAGHEDKGGYLINPGAPVEYAVNEVWYGKEKMWWLQSLLSRDAAGRAHWKVEAVMALPDLPAGHRFVMGLCRKDGVAMPAIIAAVRLEDKEIFIKIMRAWFVNLKMKRFEEYPVSGVTCVNEGYGV